MKTLAKVLSMLLAAAMCVALFAACTPADPGKTSDTGKDVVYQTIDDADAVERTDYTSVYEKIGSKVTIDMVKEQPDGSATVEVDGVTYTLGMDFLSMAMVYNTKPAGKFDTAEKAYNEWWKLYIQRWNLLVAEIPLYSNQYFDLYNAKFQNFVTTPYWGAADAIVAATVKEGAANSAILGSSTDLSGAFRNASWGKSSPAASDNDVMNLTTGFSTVMSGKDGAYNWNMMALAEVPARAENEDGTLTYTIKLKNDMKFSDGSAITAKNYIVSLLANSTEVAVAAGGTGTAGLQLVGYKEFKEGSAKYFKGVQLIDDYTFAVTFTEDYADYYYSIIYAGYSPNPLPLYLGSKGDIVVDPETKACGLNDDFYAKESAAADAKYIVAGEITENMKWNSKLPYSGPYVVSKYDDSNKIATLKLNPQYPGDDARGKASIETISYVKVVSETQMDQFEKGEVDVIDGITGGNDTKAALALVEKDKEKYAETHYDRAGYGKIGFRGDFGPSMFQSVRQAIMYTINRPEFADAFTGGYGSVVHAAYYTGFSAYQAVKDTINLNAYTYSADKAISVLEADGWVYNVKGQTFTKGTDDVRYKKLSGYELTKDNLHFSTVDGKYKTVKIDGAYYMPLAINYYGTQPNTVTDLLITAWQTNSVATTDIGMYIQYISCEFQPGVYGQLKHMTEYGYNGTPTLNAINFASSFNSAAYDYAFNWTINQEMYEQQSAYNIMDNADFWADYQK